MARLLFDCVDLTGVSREWAKGQADGKGSAKKPHTITGRGSRRGGTEAVTPEVAKFVSVSGKQRETPVVRGRTRGRGSGHLPVEAIPPEVVNLVAVAEQSYEEQVAQRQAVVKEHLAQAYLRMAGSPTPSSALGCDTSTGLGKGVTHAPPDQDPDKAYYDEVMYSMDTYLTPELLDSWDQDPNEAYYDEAMDSMDTYLTPELLASWDHEFLEESRREVEKELFPSAVAKTYTLRSRPPNQADAEADNNIKKPQALNKVKKVKPRPFNKEKPRNLKKDFFDLSDRFGHEQDQTRLIHRQKKNCPWYLDCPVCTGRPCSSNTKCFSDF